MDISASRDTLFMARAILKEAGPMDATGKLEKWADFESKIPNYLYADSGELKEWATENLGEKHQHRHVSHAYPAWPGYETQTDDTLREGILEAMAQRSAAYGGKEASESHGPTHKALVAARLKDPDSLNSVLLYLMTNNYQYSSMMTSHNDNHSSTYCTDSAFGIMGAVNESLLYSNTGEIEILPALLDSVGAGSITGLMARCRAEVNKITWNMDEKRASVTITSDRDNNEIALSCAPSWSSASVGGSKQAIHYNQQNKAYIALDLDKNETITVDFVLGDRIQISTSADTQQRIYAGSEIPFTAKVHSLSGNTSDVSWHVVNAIDNLPFEGASISDKGVLTVNESAKGKMLKVYASSKDGAVSSNKIMLHVSAKASASADGEEPFMAYAGLSDGQLDFCFSNNGQKRKLRAVWAAYDGSGSMAGMSEKRIEVDTNGYVHVTIPAEWNTETYPSSLMLWDADTLVPVIPRMEVKK